jgi:uncharacterized protein
MSYLPLVLFSALIHAYVGWRLLPALADMAWAMPALAGTLALSAVLVPCGLLARRVRSRRLSHLLSWAGLLFMGLCSSLFVLTVVRDLGLLLAHLVLALWPAAFDLPTWAQSSAAAVALGAAAITLIGLWNARRTAAVVAIDVPIRGLPAALHGFRIAQISDIHIGPTIKRGYLQAIVEAVNRLDADMVAVTGDLVDGTVAELGGHVAPLAGLLSRHGTYFVTGNHEYYSGAHAWIAELRRLGVRVLMNEHVVLEHGEASLLVAGVTDYGAHHFDPSHRSDPQAALHQAPDHARIRVLLAHQPRSATAAALAGFHLQLSGHTHGGQFLPWTFLVRLQQPFTAGLYRRAGLWVYVSRGTGYWGPPKRFGAPSEITHLRFVNAPT